jgi:CheY-like chemotaxis protein
MLTAVEGFSQSAAADVLGIRPSELDQLLQKAANEMVDQKGARVLIIEDQQFIAAKLEFLMGHLGHEVVGISATQSEAVDEARRSRPDLILSDIQLADGSSGLVAMDDIQTERNVPFIIITAHPELLLTGKRQEPAFVICKPFVDDSVAAVISQALFLRDAGLMNASPSLVDPVVLDRERQGKC